MKGSWKSIILAIVFAGLVMWGVMEGFDIISNDVDDLWLMPLYFFIIADGTGFFWFITKPE